MKSLSVCIDARLTDGSAGGVMQAVMGLASGISKLEDGDEEYLFLVYGGENAWLRQYLGGACRILEVPLPHSPSWKNALKRIAPSARGRWQKLKGLAGSRAIRVPVSNGIIERTSVDVMHFMLQDAFLTNVPSIYQPHDLQHLHFPKYFSGHERLAREIRYRAFCGQARAVAVMTRWSKRDISEHYGLPDEKVKVIPWAPVAGLDGTEPGVEELRKRFSLPGDFLFYPAQTWPHKNHIGLLEALAILRDRMGLNVPLVCSGHRNDFFPQIEKKVRKLRLEDQVRFVGFVEPAEIRGLYGTCTAVVFPSKFEGWGLPITEAFHLEKPVACSNAASLRGLAGDAALLFDPDDPQEMAREIRRLWTDTGLRARLVQRGRERSGQLSWERTARTFRALYRSVAGRNPGEEDRALLSAPPPV